MNKGIMAAVVAVAAIIAIFVFHGRRAPPVASAAPISMPVPATAAPAAPQKARAKLTRPVYHRVLKGGKIGGPMACGSVPLVAHQYPKEQVIAFASKLGMTPAQLDKLRVCLN